MSTSIDNILVRPGASRKSNETDTLAKRKILLSLVQKDLERLDQLRRETKELEERSISELSHVLDFVKQDDDFIAREGLAVTLTFRTEAPNGGSGDLTARYLRFDINDPAVIRQWLEEAIAAIYRKR